MSDGPDDYEADVATDGHFPVWRKGATPFYAAPGFTGFSYCAYVPQSVTPGRIIVAVHGSGRSAEEMRRAFADFAERTGSVLICPLFPIGAQGEGDEPAYKFILWDGLRYDHALDAMLEDAAQRFGFAPAPFHLFGFSGGGQFVQRYLLVRPDRLASASIGAPGYVTWIDPDRPWWTGTADMAEQFGAPCDLGALRQVPVQIVVGAEDTGTAFLTIAKESPIWAEGANDMGASRIEKARRLGENMRAHGIGVRFDLAGGTGHELSAEVIRNVIAFWTGEAGLSIATPAT